MAPHRQEKASHGTARGPPLLGDRRGTALRPGRPATSSSGNSKAPGAPGARHQLHVQGKRQEPGAERKDLQVHGEVKWSLSSRPAGLSRAGRRLQAFSARHTRCAPGPRDPAPASSPTSCRAWGGPRGPRWPGLCRSPGRPAGPSLRVPLRHEGPRRWAPRSPQPLLKSGRRLCPRAGGYTHLS